MVDQRATPELRLRAGDEVGQDAAGKVRGGDAVAGVAAAGGDPRLRVVRERREPVAREAERAAPGVGEADPGAGPGTRPRPSAGASRGSARRGRTRLDPRAEAVRRPAPAEQDPAVLGSAVR